MTLNQLENLVTLISKEGVDSNFSFNFRQIGNYSNETNSEYLCIMDSRIQKARVTNNECNMIKII